MRRQVIKSRVRFFVAVEGESEQSFVRWLQSLSEGKSHIHLDCIVLGGGGFKSMLEEAICQHKWRSRKNGVYKDRFLIVDNDRAEQGDWPIDRLKKEAAGHGITVSVQNPNHEGLLLRMMPGMESEGINSTGTVAQLKKRWPNYKKPMNAQALARQFLPSDLLRAAKVDSDLSLFLEKIGLISI